MDKFEITDTKKYKANDRVFSIMRTTFMDVLEKIQDKYRDYYVMCVYYEVGNWSDYQFGFSGTINKNETVVSAVKRESKEELCFILDKFNIQTEFNHYAIKQIPKYKGEGHYYENICVYTTDKDITKDFFSLNQKIEKEISDKKLIYDKFYSLILLTKEQSKQVIEIMYQSDKIIFMEKSIKKILLILLRDAIFRVSIFGDKQYNKNFKGHILNFPPKKF